MGDSGNQGGRGRFRPLHDMVGAWSQAHLLIDVLAILVSVGTLVGGSLSAVCWW